MPRQGPPAPILTVPPSSSSSNSNNNNPPPLSSPRSPRGNVHPTSSLRDPLPNATPPHSRSPSEGHSDVGEDDFLAHQTKGVGRRRTRKADGHPEDGSEKDHASPHQRGDKRRRVASRSNRQGHSDGAQPSPSHSQRHHHSNSPSSPHQSSNRRMHPTLAPIKPIGFAQSREYRRDDSGERPIPSPVVMGFDFKAIDEGQLKTVRDTISIREQQQALIAARRKETVASQPATPKELTFKGWQPKDPSSVGVGKRREKTRATVEGMTINTGASDMDTNPGSKSAPLGHTLAAQQQSPREHPVNASGHPPTILPPLPGYSHLDPRTAPLSHTRTRNGDERDHREHEYRNQYWRSLPRAAVYENMPHTARPAITLPSDRRNFTTPVLHPPPTSSTRDRQPSGGRPSRNGQFSRSPTPPAPTSREAFPQPQQSIYDLMHQADQIKFSLQDLLHRYEGAYASQLNSMNDFKNTAAQANTLLSSLQASADSLKEMVRYEVGRAGSADRREIDELRDQIKRLKEQVEGKK